MTNDDRFPEEDQTLVRRALRAELAAEPVPVDPERRETAIRAALDATAVVNGSAGTVNGRRPTGGSRWRRSVLAAAASVAVLAATGVGLLVANGDSTDETASVESSGTVSSAEDQTQRSASPGVELDRPLQLVPHLGDFDSVDALLAQAGRSADLRAQAPEERLEPDESGLALTGPSDGSSTACPPEPDAPSRTVVGTAMLNGAPVNVVIDTEGELVVLSIDGCQELARG
jgi:hypothetical protein